MIDVAARAAELLPRGRAAPFNQAMMELGATVCRPRNPDCARCPVERGCLAPGRHSRCVASSPRNSRTPIDGHAGASIASLLPETEIPLQGERLERALAGLERDGLIVRDASGRPHLP